VNGRLFVAPVGALFLGGTALAACTVPSGIGALRDIHAQIGVITSVGGMRGTWRCASPGALASGACSHHHVAATPSWRLDGRRSGIAAGERCRRGRDVSSCQQTTWRINVAVWCVLFRDGGGWALKRKGVRACASGIYLVTVGGRLCRTSSGRLVNLMKRRYRVSRCSYLRNVDGRTACGYGGRTRLAEGQTNSASGAVGAVAGWLGLFARPQRCGDGKRGILSTLKRCATAPQYQASVALYAVTSRQATPALLFRLRVGCRTGVFCFGWRSTFPVAGSNLRWMAA
jgi:hypothetical protein